MRFYHLIKNRKFLRSAVAIKSKLKTKNSHSTTTKSNRTSKITAVVPRTPKRNQQKRKEKIHFWPIFKKFRSIQFNKKKWKRNHRVFHRGTDATQTQQKEKNKLFHFAFLVFLSVFFYMIYYYSMLHASMPIPFHFLYTEEYNNNTVTVSGSSAKNGI